MSRVSHTPGPWRIKRWSGKEAQVIGTVPIASGPQKGELPFISLPASNADACLIAAAPDMLEALEECKRQLEYLDGRSPSGTTPATLLRVRAAIAKAKGGAS
ncbi:hypothetical protein HME9302_00950 [Alteripontixanthobacter maritimus]|uniref:Uncharacterized protein n=1 Tax=Alteripontixanthobacter maritimus TaxID=2161824 RepID=A0A369Q893_9SPHN|nr:hypothetical protein [Alteripontixanthobacter maritimus]RDC59755.1 hypothetical protein HME9302_00950 [Alteripontixanthobacter maritimus]